MKYLVLAAVMAAAPALGAMSYQSQTRSVTAEGQVLVPDVRSDSTAADFDQTATVSGHFGSYGATARQVSSLGPGGVAIHADLTALDGYTSEWGRASMVLDTTFVLSSPSGWWLYAAFEAHRIAVDADHFGTTVTLDRVDLPQSMFAYSRDGGPSSFPPTSVISGDFAGGGQLAAGTYHLVVTASQYSGYFGTIGNEPAIFDLTLTVPAPAAAAFLPTLLFLGRRRR